MSGFEMPFEESLMDHQLSVEKLSSIELSWNEDLKLTETLANNLLLDDGTAAGGSESNSPVRSSSGYGSQGESSPQRRITPPPGFFGASLNLNTSGGGRIPIWSPNHRNLSDELSLYNLIPPLEPIITNDEVEIDLQPGKWSTLLPQEGIQAVATHSSGHLNPMGLEKVQGSSLNYKCKFTPRLPGRYFLKVNQEIKTEVQSVVAAAGGAETTYTSGWKQVTAPLELLVTRNYQRGSQSTTMNPIKLEPNMDKYWGIAFDDYTNRLYVSDRLNNDVIIVDPLVGKPIHRFGQDKSFYGRVTNLFRPTGITVDHANKRIAICDKDNNRISLFSMDGHFISSFGAKGHGVGEFNYPWDVAVSPTGNLMAVSDSRNHRIQLFDRYGNFISKYSVFEKDPFEYKHYFDYPRGITFDNEGKYIYCTDFHTNNVLSLCVDTWESRLLAPQGRANSLIRPQGITMDDMGQLLVCDSRRNCIRVMTTSGDLAMTVDKVKDQELMVPTDVCVTRWGQVIVINLNGKINIF